MTTDRRLLVNPATIPPSREDLEVIGAFNPAAVRVGDEVVLLVRVAQRARERRAGFVGLPRWCAEQKEVTVDWLPEAEWEPFDPRWGRVRSTGLTRLTFVSHLQVMRCGVAEGTCIVGDARMEPVDPLEEFGVEDPRITDIVDRFWFTYVAVSRHGAATALASTRDFRTFERHGPIFCPENKDVVLFPERIGGEFVAIHRPVGAAGFARPEMWLARSPDLTHWGRHQFLYGGLAPWESGRVGAGPPPVRVPGGWLLIYHGNRRPTRPGDVGMYQAGALLLDAKEPSRVLARTVEPIFSPRAEFEMSGFVSGVVFPTGLIDDGARWLLYYGAADDSVGVAEISKADLDGQLTAVVA